VKKFSLFFLLLIFSCAAPKISNLAILSGMEESLKIQANYNSYLALEYLYFARDLEPVDPKASDHFAAKGIDVAQANEFIPENPNDWQADAKQIEEMVLLQKRLETVMMTVHMKSHLPIQLAHLSYLYDCWISRESKEVFLSDDLARCRIKFDKLLDEVERYIEDLKKDKTAKVKVTEPEFERFEILFDFNNFKLNDRAFKELLALLKYLSSLNGNYRILLVGNADRVGKELYNQNLALMRVEVVKKYLQKNV
jgi:outer membrane protein OmpA-like peptidoglycan-associated protein